MPDTTTTDPTLDSRLSPLQRVLLTGLADLRREPGGGELYAVLQRDAAEQFALLEQPQLTAREAAQLAELAGRVFTGPRLARLIRGGIAGTVAAALGCPQDWLLVCRALKHVPAWVLEDDAERAARLAADNAGRSGRGRPGRAAREAAAERTAAERELYAAPPAAVPPDPALPFPPDASPGEIRDYLRQPGVWFDPIRKFGDQDQLMLNAISTPQQRQTQALLTEEAMILIESAWTDIARGRGPNRDLVLRNVQTGQRITRADAERQLERIAREGLLV